MSQPEDEYTKNKARSLSKMQKLGSHSYSSCSKHLGCIKSPLISIPLSHIILDELHLLLRIGDVLLRNLIWYMDSLDHRSKAHMGEQTNHIRQLGEVIHSCGVSFQVWQNREPSGKPIPGSYDFTPLSDKDKLKVFMKLPAKMDSLLSEDLAPQVARLRNVCYNLCICNCGTLYIQYLRFQDFHFLYSIVQVPHHLRPRLTLHEKVQCVNPTSHFFFYNSECKHQSIGKALGE